MDSNVHRLTQHSLKCDKHSTAQQNSKKVNKQTTN